ncbi:hypothetical protein [Mycolicibacterium vinylchloridicum]|uniref:hypothetical protein n=1 Tax=Mycolicibacterium vinylchloridicum TaxID=2736928 RepID=UPI0015CDA39D|nr:hypothetical protein [Mycolicibacterium vinylchloridicum]
MTNPFDDTSRWTVMASRFETPQFLLEAMDNLMEEFIASLPEDSPALEFWRSLPKPPRDGVEAPSAPYTLDHIFTLRPGFWWAV